MKRIMIVYIIFSMSNLFYTTNSYAGETDDLIKLISRLDNNSTKLLKSFNDIKQVSEVLPETQPLSKIMSINNNILSIHYILNYEAELLQTSFLVKDEYLKEVFESRILKIDTRIKAINSYLTSISADLIHVNNSAAVMSIKDAKNVIKESNDILTTSVSILRKLIGT